MRILLLAPHPFFQERGTPIAVGLLLSALAERGETVDVLTYHEGDDQTYDGNITIHRIPNQPLARNIRPGFSLKKLICDAAMRRKALAMAKATRYDCIHAVEESVFFARKIARLHNIPYIFDMDSSMPRQIADKIPLAKPFLPLMRRIEARAIRDAEIVVPMCRDLADYALACGAKKTEVLYDISLLPENHTPNPEHGFRKELGLSGPALLYIGNLESYQGIDLMLEAFAIVTRNNQTAQLVIVGGQQSDITAYQQKAGQLNIANRTHFTGPRPINYMADLFNDADILVSPRTRGNNTPMKIYSYLDSGRAILATDLPTHTQVLSSDTARLAAPNPESFATAMLDLINDRPLREKLSRNAKNIAREKYSRQAFRATTNRIYDGISDTVKYNKWASKK